MSFKIKLLGKRLNCWERVAVVEPVCSNKVDTLVGPSSEIDTDVSTISSLAYVSIQGFLKISTYSF